MDVNVSSLRAELASWLHRVQDGEEIIVTERGRPVARLSPIHTAPRIEQLLRDGVIGRAQSPTRVSARDTPRVRLSGPGSKPGSELLSDLVAEQRR